MRAPRAYRGSGLCARFELERGDATGEQRTALARCQRRDGGYARGRGDPARCDGATVDVQRGQAIGIAGGEIVPAPLRQCAGCGQGRAVQNERRSSVLQRKIAMRRVGWRAKAADQRGAGHDPVGLYPGGQRPGGGGDRRGLVAPDRIAIACAPGGKVGVDRSIDLRHRGRGDDHRQHRHRGSYAEAPNHHPFPLCRDRWTVLRWTQAQRREKTKLKYELSTAGVETGLVWGKQASEKNGMTITRTIDICRADSLNAVFVAARAVYR